jgi:hypothetical protein
MLVEVVEVRVIRLLDCPEVWLVEAVVLVEIICQTALPEIVDLQTQVVAVVVLEQEQVPRLRLAALAALAL